MTNLESLRSLQKRIREATGPDRNLDWDIREAFYPGRMGQAPLFTLDPDGLGPCVALQRAVLPGWCWRIGTCCVSDDAWVAPDWDSPTDGARLRAQYGEPLFGTVFDQGVDIDRRPPGNVCLAFLDAIIGAMIAELQLKEPVKC